MEYHPWLHRLWSQAQGAHIPSSPLMLSLSNPALFPFFLCKTGIKESNTYEVFGIGTGTQLSAGSIWRIYCCYFLLSPDVFFHTKVLTGLEFIFSVQASLPFLCPECPSFFIYAFFKTGIKNPSQSCAQPLLTQAKSTPFPSVLR